MSEYKSDYHCCPISWLVHELNQIFCPRLRQARWLTHLQSSYMSGATTLVDLSLFASMASQRNLLLLLIFSLPILSTATSLLLPTKPINSDDIHDLFPQYGLPKGLLPNAVESYTIYPDGTFLIHLTRPCYVQFDVLAYYDKTIKGKLSYASVSEVSGIQAKKFFLWVTVSGMDVDKSSGMIEFHVGALSQKLPAKQFETIPNCKNKGCPHTHSSSLPQSF